MKLLITESKLKKLVSDRFGLELTNRIHMITGPYQLPMHWDRHFTPDQLNKIMNDRGPLYLIEYGREEYIIIPTKQKSPAKWYIYNKRGDILDEFEFMKILGIETLGLEVDDLLNLFFNEIKN